jgi:hypothetical protein
MAWRENLRVITRIVKGCSERMLTAEQVAGIRDSLHPPTYPPI